MTTPSFSRRQRVLLRRSVIFDRPAEFGVIVKRHPDEPNLKDWYLVRADDGGTFSEHAEMLSDALPDWREREVIRLRAEADEAARRENEDIAWRWKAEGLREVAERLAA
jgi:hypothetical protein